MINKYASTCSCGERVAVGEGEATRIDGRWMVRCGACQAPEGAAWYNGAPTALTRPAGSTARFPGAYSAGPVTQHTRDIFAEIDGGYTLLSGHAASPYQAAVFDHFRTGRGSRIINAVAGSGKTTTMKNALRYLPEWANVQMFAFNTEAAEQLSAAIDDLRAAAAGLRQYRNVRAGTFHSVGFYAVRRHLNLAKIEIDPGKCGKLLRQHLGTTDEGEETRRLYAAFALQLVTLAKGEGIGALTPDLDAAWYDLVEHHGLYLDSEEASVATGIAIARRLLGWSNEAAKAGVIDFDDQLYLVCLWKLSLWRNHVVIADEAQDTNPVRRAMLHLALKDGGRLYAVGDRKQSIYGFTGASTDAIDLIAQEFNCREMPLTVSYRCARRIVERAQTWVPYIEATDSAPVGAVHDDVPLHAALAQLGTEDAILCRQTAPLVSVAYGLIARGRPCRILGREIGEGLVNLIETQRAKGVDRLVKKLEVWRDREQAKFIAKGEERRAEAVADRVNCILVLIEALPETERTVPALIRKIQTMFVNQVKGEKQTVLTLCTAHKSKGKEWSTVAILRPELMPSKAARQSWQMDQETNLQYVAATRAKDTLIYIADEDMTIDAPRCGEG